MKNLKFLVMLLFAALASSAWAAEITIEANGQAISDTTTWTDCTVNITGSGTVTYSKRIVISGSVTINLGVGTTLVASSGIEVDEGNELTIEGDGALNAIVADNFYAAIGRGFHGNTPGTSGIININGGIITATGGKFAAGIGGGDTGAGGTININGGTIVATGGYLAAGIGGGVYGAGGVINISGGQVTAISDDRASGIGPGYKGGISGTVTLGWTNNDDFIYATNYDNVEKLTLDDEFYFVDNGEHVIATTANIGGKTLYPLIDKNTLEYANISGIEPYYRYTGNDIEITYTVTDLEGNPMEYGKDYTAKFSPSTIKEKGDYTLTVMAAGSHYTGSKNISFSVVDNIAVTASTTEMNEKYGVPYKVSNDVRIDSRIKIVGDILLVLDEGKTLTASKGIELSKGNKLTIEGNGNLTATGDGNNAGIGALEVGTLIINSGNITATGGDEGSAGIGGSKTNYQGNTDGGFITINGGSVNATGSPYAAAIGGSLMGVCGSITINGGKVTANGGIHVVAGNNVNGYGIGPGYKGTKSGTITLGWTDEDDFIYFSSIADVENIRFAAGKNFFYAENNANVVAIIDNIENKTLHPYLEKVDFENVSIRGIKPYYPYTGNNIDIEYEVYDAGGNKLTINDDYTAEFSQTPINGKGDYTLTVTAASGSNFTGSKSLTFHVVDYISVTAETTTMTADYGLSYRVDDNVTVDERITINGDVMLFLDKDKTLNASKGVELSAGNKLTIEGRGILQASGEDSKAGIGARNVGMLVVNGNVLAKGGNNAAGIGGSSNNTSGGTIIINSGEIVAKGGLGAAGIGGGLVGPCGTVSINGGKIVAEGGIYGDLISSGIGPGDYGQKSGTVTLGWTTENDRVFANNFNNVENLQFAKGKRFYMIDGDSIVVATPENIDGKILYPLIEQNQIGKELSHSDITIAAIPDQTYSGSEICPAVIVNDGETTLTIGTDYTVECSDNVSAGTAKMTITGAGNYVGTVEKTFEIVPKVIHASGAVQVLEDQDGKRAVIDGEYRGDGSVDIPEGIEGVSVEFNRTFTVGKYSTIVLPFEIGEDKVMGADFYKIEDIKVAIKDVDTTWGPVQISKVTGKIEANTPYLLKPTATRLDFVDAVTLNTSEKHPYGFTKAGVQWEFRGTYHFFDFGIDSTHLVGKSYGFAAKDQPDGLKVGDFRWTSDKSYILPMRGYLVYNEVEENKASKKSPQMRYAPRMSVSSIPETLEVEIVDADGGTTVIGQLDTRTGEIRLNGRMADRWFDMQGRVLKGKPTVKGRYLHNGKIEVIK